MAKNKKIIKNSLTLSGANNTITPGLSPTTYLNSGLPFIPGAGSLTTTENSGFSIAQEHQSILLASNNARSQPLFNNWIQLLKIYTSEWLFQNAVNIPVQDAFVGMKITAPDGLDDFQIQQIMQYMKINKVSIASTNAKKWGFVFGGGVVIAYPKNGNPTKPLKKGEEVYWLDVNLWRCNNSQGQSPYLPIDEQIFTISGLNINPLYQSNEVHPSRCFAFKSGIPAPDYFKSITRGWDMSLADSIISALNTSNRYLNALFQTAKESYIDVVSVDDLETAMMTEQGFATVLQNIQRIAEAKSSLGIMVINKDNEFNRKEINVSAIAGMWDQIKFHIAGSFMMPTEKLFGESAKGINNGGEANLENYCIRIEGIRELLSVEMLKVVSAVCIILFGYIPEGLDVSFTTPRILTPDQELALKAKQIEILNAIYEKQLIDNEEYIDHINETGLFKKKFDTSKIPKGLYEPMEGDFDFEDSRDKEINKEKE